MDIDAVEGSVCCAGHSSINLAARTGVYAAAAATAADLCSAIESTTCAVVCSAILFAADSRVRNKAERRARYGQWL